MTKQSHNKPEAPPPAVPSPREVEDVKKDEPPKKTFTERPGFFRGARVRKT